MLAASSAQYRPNGMLIFIPLPFEVVQRLRERKENIERHKNEYIHAIRNSGQAPFYGVLSANKLAALFLQYVIFQDYVPPCTQNVIGQCLELTTTASTGNLNYFGFQDSHVLIIHVAGMKLVLLNLRQAANSSLFLPVPLIALRALAKQDVPCPQGSSCQNILNGKCPQRHLPQDVAHAGAIVTERIALPECKSRELLRGQQQQQQDKEALWHNLSRVSGASIQLQEENDGKFVVLTGSRLAVGKGMELVTDLVSKIIPQDFTIVKKTIRNVSPHKAKLLYGTNGETLEEITLASRTETWFECMKQGDVQCLHIRGRPEAVDYCIQLVLGWWHSRGESVHDVDLVSCTSDITEKVVTEPANSSVAVPIASSSSTVATNNDKTPIGTSKGEDTWPALGLKTLKAPSTVSPRIRATQPNPAAQWNTRASSLNPPAKIDDTKEWPSLQSEATKESSSDGKPVPSSNAMLPYAKKAAMPPKPVPTKVSVAAKKTLSKKHQSSVTTVDYKHPCIHGSRCQFIKSGKDQCKFFHSTKELEEAAARYTSHIMDLSPVVVGYVIGDKGSRLKQLEEKTGTNMFIDQDSMGSKENRILHISGEPQCIEKAVKLVKKLLPKKFDVEASHNASSNVSGADRRIVERDTKAPKKAPKEPTPAPPLSETTNHAHATATVQKANPNKKVEHIMYISPAVVGWIIGKDGKILKEKIQKGGAKMEIDSESMRLSENKIVYITGKQKAIDAAIELVMEQLPNGYKPESGPGVPGGDSSPDNDSPKPVTSVNTVTPDFQDDCIVKASNLGVPGKPSSANPTASGRSMVPNTLDYQHETETLISPPRPIRQLHQDESVGFVSSSTSLSSASDIIPSNVTTSGHVSPSFMTGHGGDMGNAILAGGILPPVAQPFSTVSSLASWEKVIAPSTTTVSTAPTVASLASDSTLSNDFLFSFLVNQETCLKGSAKNFYEWLATEDICSLNDLAEAVTDENYLRDVLQQGNGTVGVKGFKRAAFQKAVLVASQSINGGNSVASLTYKSGAF